MKRSIFAKTACCVAIAAILSGCTITITTPGSGKTTETAVTTTAVATTTTTTTKTKATTATVPSKKPTTSKTTTTSKKITKPTITKPSTSTASTEATTISIKITTTTIAPKTTRAATEKELELLYSIAYNRVMGAYYEYRTEQAGLISDLKAKIADLQDEASAYNAEYQLKLRQLKEKYASMGLLNSGAYVSAQQALECEYKNNVSTISEEITALKAELAQAEKDYESSTSECEGLIEEEFWLLVEEFQQSTLS